MNSKVEFMKPFGWVLQSVLSAGPKIYLYAVLQTRILHWSQRSAAWGEVTFLSQATSECIPQREGQVCSSLELRQLTPLLPRRAQWRGPGHALSQPDSCPPNPEHPTSHRGTCSQFHLCLTSQPGAGLHAEPQFQNEEQAPPN